MQEKQGRNWLGNTSTVVFLLAILGALIYGVTVFHKGYIQEIKRGESGQAAIRILDEMRSSLLTLKQDESLLLQSTDKAHAVASIENAVNQERQVLSKYLKLANYNEELRMMAPRLMVSFEAWASLELELVNEKAALLADQGNWVENGELGILMQRNLLAFLNVMDVLGEGEKPIVDDIKAGAAAANGLFMSTLVFIAYLICLAFWWVWSTASRERRHYKNVRQLHNMSNTDSLTGLTNRVVFEDRLSAAIAGARRFGSSVGVLYFDIEALSEVNVEKGYQSGDIVLKEAALRLQQYTREMDTVARVGEDEFAVLITNLKQKDDAQVVADKLKNALTQPIELNGEQYSPSVSIGIAVFPYDGEQSEQLVNHASSAMYEEKRNTKLNVASSQH